jgi:hypothetical protein
MIVKYIFASSSGAIQVYLKYCFIFYFLAESYLATIRLQPTNAISPLRTRTGIRIQA